MASHTRIRFVGHGQYAKLIVLHGTRMMREFPERGIEAPPQLVATMIPRPAQVHGQIGQRFKAPRWGEVAGCGFAHNF